ncbi:unnamed protein product [Brassica oleracea var. botrytis]
MLGIIPDAILIMVSGFSGNVATARSQVSLTGSTVMLPTVTYGTCTVVGKCNICETMATVTFLILLMPSCGVLRRRW